MTSDYISEESEKSRMDRVIGVIYETYDYSKFKRLENNRAVTDERKAKLRASFSVKEIMNPVVVNKKFEIIDGQGRYEAKKDLGLPIYYVIDADATIDDCRRMNAYNTQWSLSDFCESYAASGNQNYILLIDTCKRLDLSIHTVSRLANSDFSASDLLRKGEFVFTEEDRVWIISLVAKIKQIADALGFTGRINETFRASVRIMTEFEEYDHDSFLRNCKYFKTRFAQMSRIQDQLKEFSDIYNYRRKTENKKLYFEDYMRNRGANVRPYSSQRLKVFQPDVSTLKRVGEYQGGFSNG